MPEQAEISKQLWGEIDALVFSYQNGNDDAGGKLIEIFEPYLNKYLRLTKDGFFNIKDRDSRRFVALFINDSDARRRLLKSQQNADAQTKAHTAAGMVHGICRDIPSEDMHQELICILLTLAKRYQTKGEKINFCGYLYNVYRYEFFRRLNQITNDPIVHRSDTNLSYDDDSCINEDEMILNNPSLYTCEPIMILDEDLGNSWIRGLTCGEMFEKLNPTQRLIIKLKYNDSLTDIEIGEQMGLHRNTIRAQRTKAVDIIRQQIIGDSNGENC